MAAPTTYSEWTVLLEKFGQGDDMVIDEMNTGTFVIDAGTASRFYSRVEEVYKARKKSWLDKFQRSFQLQNFKTEDDFGIALRDGKLNLVPLSKFVAINGLPDDLKKTLKKDLEDFVSEMRKSLKDNVSKVSNGREKMLLMLNSFGLIENSQDIPIKQKQNNQNTNNLIPPTGRKIIF